MPAVVEGDGTNMQEEESGKVGSRAGSGKLEVACAQTPSRGNLCRRHLASDSAIDFASFRVCSHLIHHSSIEREKDTTFSSDDHPDEAQSLHKTQLQSPYCSVHSDDRDAALSEIRLHKAELQSP